jgi:hypothetical protein
LRLLSLEGNKRDENTPPTTGDRFRVAEAGRRWQTRALMARNLGLVLIL